MSQTNTSQHKGLDAIMQPSSITEGEQTREKCISKQLKEERQQIKNENCIVRCEGSVQQSLDIIQKTEAAIDSELEKIRGRNEELDNKEFNERHNEITKQIVSQSKKALPSVIKNGVVKGFKSIKKTVIGEDELVGVQE